MRIVYHMAIAPDGNLLAWAMRMWLGHYRGLIKFARSHAHTTSGALITSSQPWYSLWGQTLRTHGCGRYHRAIQQHGRTASMAKISRLSRIWTWYNVKGRTDSLYRL